MANRNIRRQCFKEWARAAQQQDDDDIDENNAISEDPSMTMYLLGGALAIALIVAAVVFKRKM